MFQKKSSFFIFIALIILSFGGYTLDTSILEARTQNQTIPTRTPIPAPTDSNSGGGNNGGNNGGGSSPTNTPVPANTATATAVPVTIAATPAGGFITPEACGQPFFISVEGNTNVRQGPDITKGLVGQLVYLEARAIFGRSADLEWWYIELATSERGWVADIAGDVQGNISGVPLVNEDGSLTNISPSWNPTPNPSCPTVTPTATPTATLEPTATSTAVPETSQTSTSGDESTTESVATAEPTATSVPPTATPAPPTATPTATLEPTATAEPTLDTTSETVIEQQETSTPEPEPQSTVNWLLVSGATLLGIGGGAYFIRGRR